MIILFIILFPSMLIASQLYSMNSSSNHPASVYHGLLVLDNQRNTCPKNGLSLQLTLSNHVSRNLISAEPAFVNISHPVSPRSLVLNNPLCKFSYDTNLKNVKIAVANAAQELQALAQNTKQDFAASFYTHLKNYVQQANLARMPAPVMHFLYESVVEIKPLLFNKDGSLKILNSSDIKKICSLIDNFKDNVITMIDGHGSQWSAYEVLDDTHNLDRLQSQELSLLNDSLSTVFGSNNRELFRRFERSLESKDFVNAWNTIKVADPQNKLLLEAIYRKSFETFYNTKGIEYRFLNDPLAQDLIKDLPDSPVPCVHNIELKRRFLEKERFLDKCRIDLPCKEVELLAYQLVDTPHLTLSRKVERVCSFVSIDSTAASDQAYNQLCYANGLPRIAKYNQEVSSAQFPSSFHTKAHVKDRILIAKLGLLDSTDPEAKKQINRVIEYIKFACIDSNLAADVGKIGHVLGQAILNDETHWSLHLPDLLQEPHSNHFASIQQEVVKYLGRHSDEPNSHCDRIGSMYQRMLREDQIAQSFLEQAFITDIPEKIMAIDIDGIKADVAKVAPGAYAEVTLKQFDRVVKAYQDIKAHGAVYSEKKCFVDLQTRLFMQVKGDKYSEHFTYRGNQLEHAIHDNILENYQRGACLGKESSNPRIQNLAHAAHQSNALAEQSLHVRDYHNALHLSAFASCTYDYIARIGDYLIYAGTEITVGSSEGVIAGVKSIGHQITHPIQTIKQIAHGINSLLTIMNRLHRRPFSVLPYVNDPQALRAYSEQYWREIGIDFESFENSLKEMTLRDAARATSQFLTEGILAGEIFEFSGKVCQILKAEAQLLAHDSQLVQVSDKVGLAVEAVQANAAQTAEATMLESSQIGTHTESLIAETAQLECPPSCINQYERLQNALRIEEFTSVIDCTEHGLLRLIERGFEPGEILDLIRIPDTLKIQADGAKVFIKQIEKNKFNLLVFNSETKKVVTAIKNLELNDLLSLSENYGWNL